MHAEMYRGEDASSADAIVDISDGQPPTDRLMREQAATIAHYKKMYDRSSALAKIGVWECDLATEALTWTDGVYGLFELPRGTSLRPATSSSGCRPTTWWACTAPSSWPASSIRRRGT